MQTPESTAKTAPDPAEGTTRRMLVIGLVLGGFALSLWL